MMTYRMNCNNCCNEWDSVTIEHECPNCKAAGTISIGFKLIPEADPSDQQPVVEDTQSPKATEQETLGTGDKLQPKSTAEVAMERAKNAGI